MKGGLPFRKPSGGERGAILPFTLILLLLLTLLGLVSIRGTLRQAGEFGQQVVRQLAFENAEAALREAEARLADPAQLAAIDWNGKGGAHAAGKIDPWRLESGQTLTAVIINPEGPAARYAIERLPELPDWDGCTVRLFRITAVSREQGNPFGVTLQTTFQVPARPLAHCIARRTSWIQLK